MVITAAELSPIVALIAGILILIIPRHFGRAPRQRSSYRLPRDFCARFGHDIMHAEVPT